MNQHNAGASLAGQLKGVKAQSVKNLMDLVPPEGLAVVDMHVKQFGWENCALTDEVVSDKKWLPGYQSWRWVVGTSCLQFWRGYCKFTHLQKLT